VSPKKSAVRTVIKVGGGLLRDPAGFERVVVALNVIEPGHRVLILPGGGPFANAVREFDRRIPVGSDPAHWMAILGMDQFAHALATRIAGGQLVEREAEIGRALDRGRIPVLAPYRWLRATDPLPHSWDVTSDSIAAWIAATVGARRLVLIKPAAGEAGSLVDAYFVRALKPGIEHLVLPVDDVRELRIVLGEYRGGPRSSTLRTRGDRRS